MSNLLKRIYMDIWITGGATIKKYTDEPMGKLKIVNLRICIHDPCKQ